MKIGDGEILEAADIAEQFEKHLNSPKQSWLLGAGVSYPANIPLMLALTKRVLLLAHSIVFSDDAEARSVLDFITGDCGDASHIEHHLTHLGDLISIAERSRTGCVEIGGARVAKEKLVDVHSALIELIASIVRWGYQAGWKNEDGSVGQAERVGEPSQSIVEITGHSQFVSAIYGPGRAGLEFVRTPVEFFTTNYDTLLEDALALSGVEFADGFTGGGVGFWNMNHYDHRPGVRAVVSKLHGSIDWYRPKAGNATLLRIRHGDTYPAHGGAVMIYPQATKYINTQRDPFAELFQRFRNRLSQGSDHVLLICGYSFGDDHINAEIEMAMESGRNQLTIVAFADEPNDTLPPTLQRWMTASWANQLFIASPKGLYQGSEGPVFPGATGKRDWWTFGGASKLFSEGLPNDIQEAMA
ncbi:MAG: SIR2 family protein [Erythrobacter sp.]|nr:SIR2 family protein [Erythrobacter sp.]HAD16394.1 SIR2 family protein [Erythrobacter sp.]